MTKKLVLARYLLHRKKTGFKNSGLIIFSMGNDLNATSSTKFVLWHLST